MTVSLYLRVLLQSVGQTWIKTIAHTSTLFLLPILTYIITSVISGNIALSLGMVGALSIVRFRNPVRSPLELSVYFCAITLGISAAVSIKWSLLLIASITFVVLVLCLINIVCKFFFQKPFFISSFLEGNITSTLHVVATAEISELDASPNLISKKTCDGEISYTVGNQNFGSLRTTEALLQANKNIVLIELRK